MVNASSEPERLTVNGMSNHDRAAKNSNSAIIASVTPEDFDGNDALAGVRFQQKWEEKLLVKEKENPGSDIKRFQRKKDYRILWRDHTEYQRIDKFWELKKLSSRTGQ